MPRPKKGQPTKSEFIRKHPGLSPAALVEKAKAEGVALTPTLVYKVRGRVASKAERVKAPAAAPPTPPATAAATKAAPPAQAPAKAPITKAAAAKAVVKAAPKPAKKPAAARSAKPTATMSASDFVRSMPASMSPNDVVAKGAERGLKFSRNLVYMVRQKAAATKAPAKRGPGRPAAKAVPKAPAAAKAAAPTSAAAPETLLAQLILGHGLVRLREMLAAAEQRVTTLLGGG